MWWVVYEGGALCENLIGFGVRFLPKKGKILKFNRHKSNTGTAIFVPCLGKKDKQDSEGWGQGSEGRRVRGRGK